LANSPQTIKRAHQAAKRRERNRSIRSRVRTHIKKVVSAIEALNKEEAERAYRVAVPVIDSVARSGLIHKNKAARHKSRLNQRIRSMSR
jgi:ribosomal protein S20